ncbi:MAG: hypothetical protein HGA67_03845 [Candidatus Yonathbacteria bacterium]|nr:hypothetical protein [Candidatus Yonathbacteria bacterium]
MSLIHNIRQQPEPVRRQVFVITMVFVGVVLGSFGMSIMHKHVFGAVAKASSQNNTPFVVLQDLFADGTMNASAIMSDAGEEWVNITEQLKTWNRF